MKKLITILFLIFSIDSFGQSVVTRTTGTTTPNDVRLMASQNLFIPRFTDTTNANTNLGVDSCGAIIFTYNSNTIWYRGCSPKRWLAIGSGVIQDDTIYVKAPLYVFIDSLGRRVIAIQRANGLYSGGIVTQDSCFFLDVSSANYSINFISYTSSNTILTVSTPDGTHPRIDLVYLDTTGQAKIRAGTPAATPSEPGFNPASEIPLAYISVPTSASCLGAITKTIYDGISDYPAQWNIALSGTFTTDTINTDNPFHLNQAIFVSRYLDGSSITFTDAAADTITSTTVFKGHLYLNGALGSNNIQMQLFNTGTPVGNPITLLPYINPNDSNEYQIYQIRAGDFGVISGNIFNQYKLTFSGNDLSGAKGLYLDYIQLQNGITNSNYNGHGVANFVMNATNDSVILTRDDGVIFKVPAGSSGAVPTFQQTLIAGSILTQPNTIDVNNNELQFINTNGTLFDFASSGGVLIGVNGVSMSVNSDRTFDLQSTSSNPSFPIEILGNGNDNEIEYNASLHHFRDINGNTLLTIDSTGTINAPTYGSGTHSGVATYCTAFDTDGNVIEVACGGSSTNFAINERFTGSTSTTLTTAHNYTSGTIEVWKNGAKLDPSVDYSQATANTITISVPRLSGDVFLMDYHY